VSPPPDPDDLVEEQIAYYRARAPEYDQWWLRIGRYDQGDELAERWEAEKREVLTALEAFHPGGAVLELAAGTGNYTCELARLAGEVTAVDVSAETLAIAREKLPGHCPHVRLVEADIFRWRPDRSYDVVFFSFWLSHVPPGRFDAFWRLVADALAPGGRVFLVDNVAPLEEAAADLWWATGTPEPLVPPSRTDRERGVSLRSLADGRAFHIVKRIWSPEELTDRLAQIGWKADLRRTDTAFVYGSAVPVEGGGARR
jgi:ubiquinone/menaquinone biosynthesis C-methylase UbiE